MKNSLKGVFQSNKTAIELFTKIRECIQTLGDARMRISKTQVSFGDKRQFAWVWLPGRWTSKRPKDSIALSFALEKRVRHKRIAESVQPYPGRWMHHVIITQPSEVDGQVRSWLKRAYLFGLGQTRTKTK